MRTRLLLVALAAIGVAVALTAMPASAKVPGSNGRILYGVVDPNLGEGAVLYTANPDGSHAQQLIPGPPQASECPNWSPDGTQIAICGGDGTGAIVDVDDGSTHAVPNLY